MSNIEWDAIKMLDVYIHDYLLKRQLHDSARIFQTEANVSTEVVAIDVPKGFLLEWWTVFWDLYITRTNPQHSEAAAFYNEIQQIKAREMRKQEKQELYCTNWNQHIPMQVRLQRHGQLQQNLTQVASGSAICPISNHPLKRQNEISNAMVRKMIEDELNLQLSRDALDDTTIKQRAADNVSQLQDLNYASLLKAITATTDGQATGLSNSVCGQTLLSSPGILQGNNSLRPNEISNAMVRKMIEDELNLQLSRDALDDTTIKQRAADNVSQLQDLNYASLLKAITATTDGRATGLSNSVCGQTLLSSPGILGGNNQQVQNLNQRLSGSRQDIGSDMNAIMRSQAVVPEGLNQGGSNLTLKGWPLALRAGFYQQNNLMQSPQFFNQLPLQQQLMLQAQQNLVSPSVSGFESRRLGMLPNNQNTSLGKYDQSNSEGDLIPNNEMPAQVGSPILPHPESDMFLEQQVQKSSQQLQQLSQHPESLQQQEKIGPGSMAVDGSVSCTSKGNNQASKNKNQRKRKPASSSGPSHGPGTANTTGPSTSSPSTASKQTPGDVMTVSTLQQNVTSSTSSLMFSTDGLDSLTSAQNQLADMDYLVGDGSLGDNVKSVSSPNGIDPREKIGKRLPFKEIKHVVASSHKVECCHFSSDGKLFATGGHDNKASLWCTELFNLKSTLEEHTEWITDVRFSPNMLRVGTSSADKTVKVWDVDNPSYSLRTFTGHVTTVMSLDFHPSKNDLICSSDNSDIRYWSIKNGSCVGVFKGGATQVRFQPTLGRLLAAAVDNLIFIFDEETLVCKLKLQGHNDLVRSVCWDLSGMYLASVSDDLVRIWRVGYGSNGECIYELKTSGKKFNACAFHPFDPVLVLGCYENLELWDYRENTVSTLLAHDKTVSSLAVSNVTGLLASTSHDNHFKIWK